MDWDRRLWCGRWRNCWPLHSWRPATWRHWHEPTPQQSSCSPASRQEQDRQSLDGRQATTVEDPYQPAVFQHTVLYLITAVSECIMPTKSTANQNARCNEFVLEPLYFAYLSIFPSLTGKMVPEVVRGGGFTSPPLGTNVANNGWAVEG